MAATYEAICRTPDHIEGVSNQITKLLVHGPVFVKVQNYTEKRRAAQNRRYWAVLHDIAEQLKVNGLMLSADAWHEWAKRRFIGVRELVLPDGEIIALGQTSTDLSVAEFGDYMDTLEAWAAEHDVIFNDLPEVV
jgi:hypothetical protein